MNESQMFDKEAIPTATTTKTTTTTTSITTTTVNATIASTIVVKHYSEAKKYFFVLPKIKYPVELISPNCLR